MTVEEYTAEIDIICRELIDAAKYISGLDPVTHLSKVQWSGIIGAVQEVRAEKRMVKLMNAPFYKEWSFYQFAFHIIEQTQKLVEKQLEVQKLVSSDHPSYYDNTRAIALCVKNVIDAWRGFSPDMADASITIGDEKDVALYPTVYCYTKDEIAKLDLPSELRSYKEPIKDDNGGCFGSVFLLCLPLIILTMLFCI